MKILFDLSALQSSGNDGLYHGGAEYAKVVFNKLCELLPSDKSLEVFYNSRNNDIGESIIEKCKTKGFKINFCKNHSEISELLSKEKFDVFYSALPYSYGDLIIPPHTKFIYTIHGLRTIEYPFDKFRLKYKKANLKETLRHFLFIIFPNLMKNRLLNIEISKLNRLFSVTENQTIITVSNHSKYSMAWFFPNLDISRLKVLYSPLKESEVDNTKSADIFKSFSLEPFKYILLTGGHRSEKGAYRACRVLYRLIKNNHRIPENIKIIVLGVSYYKSYKKLTNNSDRFIFHSYVPALDLEILYKNAYLFLYPTLNEGFGYPPFEAMKYGTLCACSANSSITEVCGDSVLYFNPHDEIEMANRILQSFDEEIREEKQKKIPIRFNQVREKQIKELDILIQNIIS